MCLYSVQQVRGFSRTHSAASSACVTGTFNRATWSVAPSVPCGFRSTAWCTMSGHPKSLCTDSGRRLLVQHHSRFSVGAGASCATPALSAATRARYTYMRLCAGGAVMRVPCTLQPQTVRKRQGRSQPAQADSRITLQKLIRLKAGSLSARTSSLTVPNVLSGLCFMPS
jgi:hypothetical protein